MKCLKYESPEAKKELLQKCSQFFSEDSLYLNYRPPTPSLQSEIESIKDNFDENKKDSFELKPFTIRMEEAVERPRQKNGNVLTPNKNFISDEKINLNMPFIVYDPKGQEKIIRIQIPNAQNEE